jgi:integrase
MFYRRFLPALRRAVLPRIRFHNLGHTYASLLIAQGENAKYIQSQMGHSSISVTMDTYSHLMNTVNRDAASRLGEQVLGSKFSGYGSSLVAQNEKGASRKWLTP